MTILDAMRDPHLFGPLFQGASWAAWTAFLAYLFALPMTEGAGRTRTALYRTTGATRVKSVNTLAQLLAAAKEPHE